MALQKGYSVAIYKNGKYLDSIPYTSQDAMQRDLRNMGASFRNGIFRNMEETSITVEGKNGFKYEVEELVETRRDTTIKYNGHRYIPLSEYCLLHDISKRKASYMMDKGMLDGMKVGRNNLRYIKVD